MPPISRAQSSSRRPRSRSSSPELAPDRSKRLLLYCASGNRSARAADVAAERARVRERGLDRRRHRGLATGGPAGRRGRGPEPRAADALLATHPATRGRGRGPAEAARLEGSPDRRRRAGRAVRLLPGGGRSRHPRDRRRRRRRRVQPAAPGDPQHRAGRDAEDGVGAALDPGAEPRRGGHRAQHPARRGQHPRDHRGLRPDRRRRRQLPHPVPAQRRLGAAAKAGRLGLDPRLRGADLDLRPVRGALLSLPLPGAAAARAGAELWRRGRAGRDGRRHGPAAGKRGDQAGRGDRRAADRAAAPL